MGCPEGRNEEIRKKDKRECSSTIELIFSEQNIKKLQIVTSRAKFAKYFRKDDVDDLIDLLTIIGKVIKVTAEPSVCRDPKDNFLLALSEKAMLITWQPETMIFFQLESTRIPESLQLRNWKN
jgi:putative toxin-antitoxin system toxin component, PIN family